MLNTISAAQCRAGRALTDLTQPDLAKAAGLGLSTVVDFERGRRQVSHDVMHALAGALEAAGVEFISGNGGGAGVRLRKAPSDHAETERQIDALHEKADAMDTSGPASPRKALNTMKQAVARNDAAKLKGKLRKKRGD